MKVVSFFAGVGGICLGFRQAGFEVIAAFDFDKYAVQTYTHNVGNYIKQRDITEMTWEELPEGDDLVWTFGFPCTDLSVAGGRAGMKVQCQTCESELDYTEFIENRTCPHCGGHDVKSATRSGLFFEVMRLLDECRIHAPRKVPKVLFAENVKPLKKYLPVLEAEYTLRGYKMDADLFNSKYWGVPQNRERYFVVGLHESITQKDSFQMPVPQTKFIPKLSSILEKHVDEKYYIADEKAEKIIEQALQRLPHLEETHACLTPARVDKRQQGRRAKDNEESMFTLTAQDIHGVIRKEPISDEELIEQPLITYSSFLATQETLIEHFALTERRTEEAKRLRKEYREKYGKDFSPRRAKEVVPRTDDVMNCLTSTQTIEHMLLEMKEVKIDVIGLLDMKGHELIRRVYNPEGLAPTLTTMQGGHRQPKVLVPYEEPTASASGLIFLGGIEDSNKWLDNGKELSRNYKQGYRVYSPEGIACALTSNGGGLGGKTGLYLVNTSTLLYVPVTRRFRVRKLTPYECGLLQGFPMNEWEQVVSDSQAYKQWGNSVSVPVVRAIAQEIAKLFK